MITVYVYCKENGVFLQIDTGSIDCIMNTLEQNKDFTLTPPPDYDHVWRWVDDKWIADQPSHRGFFITKNLRRDNA